MHPVDQAIKDKVTARKMELTALTPDALRRLPLYSPEQFNASGKSQELGVYHDKTAKGEDIVIVQCKRDIFLGYGHMFAEGFVLDSADKIRDAEEDLMWEYR
jgi:hypothetical protein